MPDEQQFQTTSASLPRTVTDSQRILVAGNSLAAEEGGRPTISLDWEERPFDLY
jgi:hypothetical protein